MTGTRPGMHRVVLSLLLFCGAGLFISSAYRAATFPLTHDESLSFAGLAQHSVWAISSNNHLLNTFFMWCCSSLFGNATLSLRLPNLLAHALYIVCGLLFIRGFRHIGITIAGFAIFNLNPFVLDFFSLARGYGLALAFLMSSLYLLALAHQKRQGGFEKFLYLSVASGALAVLSNFSFLNCFLPLLLVCAWNLATNMGLKKFERKRVFGTFVLLSTSAIFLVVVLDKIFDLQMSGALYFGGHDGFISDTLDSMVRCSLYFAPYNVRVKSIVDVLVVLLFAISSLCTFLQILTQKTLSPSVSFLIVLFVAILLPILQHLFLHALFPIERAATYYIVLFGVVLLSALDTAASASHLRTLRATALALSTVIAIALCWHFLVCFKMDTNYNWGRDKHDLEVFDAIEQDHSHAFPGKMVRIGTSGLFEPSLNFYRITRNDTWLAPIKGTLIQERDGYDYLYVDASDLRGMPPDRFIQLQFYADTQTVLLRSAAPSR